MLPFALDPVAAADCLIVGFPGYRVGVAEPPLWLRQYLDPLPAHRLFLGSDRYTYVGPAQRSLGLATAARLVRETAGGLAVPAGRIACVGSSMAAVLAALVGLSVGAGLCVLGAPPISLGSFLEGWALHERRPGTERPMASAARLLDLATRAEGEDAVSWLDGLIDRLARECPRPSTLHVLTSENDFTYRGAKRLVETSGDFPNVTVRLELTEALGHDGVAKQFYGDFLPRTLSSELGLRRTEPA